MTQLPPTIADIRAAAARLDGVATRTPLLESDLLNRKLGLRLLIKAECLQRTGSFKFRGAYNKLAQLDAAERLNGVVAFSSGNHAQGVAAAAQILGISAVIVMPEDAPAIKLANTRGYGARIVTYDRWREDREAVARRIAEEDGRVIVPPYDDPRIIAGQGTVGLEILEETARRGIAVDALLSPASGGGLIAGIALAVADRHPGTPIHSVEPLGFDDTARSLDAGQRVANAPKPPPTLCDALQTAMPGQLTFAVNRRLLAGGLVVSDDEVKTAMAVAFENYKLVAEPGGAAALAAVLAGKLPAGKLPPGKLLKQPRTVVVVLSGGNVDPAVFRAALGG